MQHQIAVSHATHLLGALAVACSSLLQTNAYSYSAALFACKSWKHQSLLALQCFSQKFSSSAQAVVLCTFLDQVMLPSPPYCRQTTHRFCCCSCWAQLLDAGMDIARFNFSHGDHAGQLEVLERLRKVCTTPEIDTQALIKGQMLNLCNSREVYINAQRRFPRRFHRVVDAAEVL
eukprot:scaffold21274_cov35-Tisochrysis_lutea.AAC.2